MVDWKNMTDSTPIRVVFYGRVSTEHELQLSAFANQIDWCYDLLNQHKNWKTVCKVEEFFDEGITGTNVKNRVGFRRLMEKIGVIDGDGRALEPDKIKPSAHEYCDMIVTREVSRFGRNTIDTLSFTRALKAKGIQVYFVQDGLYTMRESDEFTLTVMSAIAQKESEKISDRVKAGQYISRQKGVLYGTGNILGYNRVRKVHDDDKRNAVGDSSVPTFEINPEEADTIRMIFNSYAEGNGLTKIRRMLIEQNRKTATGKVDWDECTISRILDNPMYIGMQRQCQTEVVNPLYHNKIKRDKDDYVMIKGDFEPIIDQELFDKVQWLRKEKHKKGWFGNGGTGGPKASDKWTPKLECGCGSKFRKFKWHKSQNGEQAIGYTCRNHSINRNMENSDETEVCNMKSIPSWHLELIGLKIFQLITGTKAESIVNTFEFIAENISTEESRYTERIQELEYEKEKIAKRQENLLDLYSDGLITKERFSEKNKKNLLEIENLDIRIRDLQNSIASLSENGSGMDSDELQDVFNTIMSMFDVSTEFMDENLVKYYVDKVVIRSDYCMEWLINLSGDAPDFMLQHQLTSNKEYSVRHEYNNQLMENHYELAFTFILNYDDAHKYRKSFGKYLRSYQWEDILVKVYVRK